MALAAALLAAPRAWADQYVQFTLDNVTLSGGGTVTGSFVFDTTLNSAGQCFSSTGTSSCLSDMNITATQSSKTVSFTTNSSSLTNAGPAGDSFRFRDSSGDALRLTVAGGASFSTTSADGLVRPSDIIGSITDTISGGSINPTPFTSVPEPASLPLFAGALIGLAFLRRKTA